MRDIIFEIEKILEDMKFKPSDAKIYSLLLEKGEMRVSEIAKELGLSARFVRDRLKDLNQRWIGYVYRAENPITVLRKLKSKIIKEIENLEKMLE